MCRTYAHRSTLDRVLSQLIPAFDDVRACVQVLSGLAWGVALRWPVVHCLRLLAAAAAMAWKALQLAEAAAGDAGQLRASLPAAFGEHAGTA